MLSLGGFQEAVPNVPEKRYNSHIIISSKGEVLTTYRKTHLYDVDLAKYVKGGVTIKESDYIQRGEDLPKVLNSENAASYTLPMSLAPTICYDLRFPEVYSILREMNADIVLVPSAFMVRTGAAHWEILLRARAIENQCYVIAAAQCGTHNPPDKTQDDGKYQKPPR